MAVVSSQDSWTHVSEIVRLIRTGEAPTRPEIGTATRLSRNTITLRVQTAQELGLIEPSGVMRARGGRAAEIWRFRGDVGRVLVAMIGASADYWVALTDLEGTLHGRREGTWNIQEGPEHSVRRIADDMRALLADQGIERAWGIGIGLPTPVNFETGKSADPVAPSKISARWPITFDVRRWFINEFKTPVWTDSVTNMTTLGASTEPGAPAEMIYVRIGTGLGAGLVSGGRIHRGGTWVAGELNHVTMSEDPQRICPCGRVGCLETYSSAWGILTDGERALTAHESPYLADVAVRRPIALKDIEDGAAFGDSACVEILMRAGDMLGRALASLITLFNPSRVTIGGFPIASNPLLMSVVERTIRTHTLAATVAKLELRQGEPDQRESLTGAVELVTDSLLSPEYLAEWGPVGSPVGVAKLLKRTNQVGFESGA